MEKIFLMAGVICIFSLFSFQLCYGQPSETFQIFKDNIGSIIIWIMVFAALILIGKMFSSKDSGQTLWMIISIVIILILTVIFTSMI